MYDTDWSLLRETIPLPLPVLMMISRAVRKQAHGQGMGRHSQQEVMAIGQADLKALSVFLGEKCCSSYSPDSAPPCSFYILLPVYFAFHFLFLY